MTTGRAALVGIRGWHVQTLLHTAAAWRGGRSRHFGIGPLPRFRWYTHRKNEPGEPTDRLARLGDHNCIQKTRKSLVIEGLGVQPHETVPWQAADLAAGFDSQIRRAEEILKAGIPKEIIDYVPPADTKDTDGK